MFKISNWSKPPKLVVQACEFNFTFLDFSVTMSILNIQIHCHISCTVVRLLLFISKGCYCLYPLLLHCHYRCRYHYHCHYFIIITITIVVTVTATVSFWLSLSLMMIIMIIMMIMMTMMMISAKLSFNSGAQICVETAPSPRSNQATS